jgi:hypothetical protein
MMAWQSMTIYVVEFLRGGQRQSMQGYRQMVNMERARKEWLAKNVGPPAEGARRDEYETQTTAVYVTDV